MNKISCYHHYKCHHKLIHLSEVSDRTDVYMLCELQLEIAVIGSENKTYDNYIIMLTTKHDHYKKMMLILLKMAI